jgi:hypothetical protein
VVDAILVLVLADDLAAVVDVEGDGAFAAL